MFRYPAIFLFTLLIIVFPIVSITCISIPDNSCINTGDRDVLNTSSKSVVKSLSYCTLYKSTSTAEASQCFSSSVPLSNNCSLCYGEFSVCALSQCYTDCAYYWDRLLTFRSPTFKYSDHKCQECLYSTQCLQHLHTCAGLNDTEYNKEFQIKGIQERLAADAQNK